ncbi:MAG: DinB family protein [Nitrolancea sp.]
MTLELIRSLYEYGRWADERIFEAAEGLTSDQLETPGTAGHGSIRETMLHLISAHRGWLSWWDGSMTGEESMQAGLESADYPSLASVKSVWSDVQRQTWAFIDGLNEADLERDYTTTITWTGQTVTLRLWQMMTHVANHGTQHRSEAAAMLTAFDRSPGYLDLIQLFMQRQATAQT